MKRPAKIDQEVAVQLATAAGVIFSGMAQGIALVTADGTMEVTAQGESYLSLTGATGLTIRLSDGSRAFRLKNASASVKAGRFTVIAEAIRELAPEPV